MDFKGKNVLITGGSRGIGYATAAEFVKSGARVVITGRDEVQLSKAAESIGAYALKWDIADISIREEMLDEVYRLLGGLDVLVNNAGILRTEDYGGILSVTPESWDQTMDVNLRGTYFLTQSVLKRWIDSGNKGRVVFVGSNNAYRALDHAYALSKYAIRGLTTGLGKAMAPYGIYVNAVAPGPCTTTILGYEDGEVHKDGSPYGRHALPIEIAKVIKFLASEDSGTMVGQTVIVDGGETLV